MPWTKGISRRRTQLPPDWQTIRAAVQRRANGQCEAKLDNGSRCPDRGTDADHQGDEHDHSLSNLLWSCSWHHDQHTASQGANARATITSKLKHPNAR